MLKYATKDGSKYTTGLDISKLDDKFDLADLKSNIENLDFEKLETTPVDLSKLSNAVKTDVAKKAVYDKLVKNVNATHTIDISDLVKKADFDKKIEEIEKKTAVINILLLIILINFQMHFVLKDWKKLT